MLQRLLLVRLRDSLSLFTVLLQMWTLFVKTKTQTESGNSFWTQKKSPTFDVGGRPYSIENIPRGFAGAQSVPAFLWSIWCLKMTLELDHSHYRCYVLYSLHLPKVYNNSFRYFV